MRQLVTTSIVTLSWLFGIGRPVQAAAAFAPAPSVMFDVDFDLVSQDGDVRKNVQLARDKNVTVAMQPVTLQAIVDADAAWIGHYRGRATYAGQELSYGVTILEATLTNGTHVTWAMLALNGIAPASVRAKGEKALIAVYANGDVVSMNGDTYRPQIRVGFGE